MTSNKANYESGGSHLDQVSPWDSIWKCVVGNESDIVDSSYDDDDDVGDDDDDDDESGSYFSLANDDGTIKGCSFDESTIAEQRPKPPSVTATRTRTLSKRSSMDSPYCAKFSNHDTRFDHIVEAMKLYEQIYQEKHAISCSKEKSDQHQIQKTNGRMSKTKSSPRRSATTSMSLSTKESSEGYENQNQNLIHNHSPILSSSGKQFKCLPNDIRVVAQSSSQCTEKQVVVNNKRLKRINNAFGKIRRFVVQKCRPNHVVPKTKLGCGGRDGRVEYIVEHSTSEQRRRQRQRSSSIRTSSFSESS